MSSFKLVVDNKHITNLRKMLERADGADVEWGIFSTAGNHPKADMPVANLQAIHEFRTDEWRRPLFHIQAARIEDGHMLPIILSNVLKFITKSAAGSRVPATFYLGNIGEAAVKDAQSMYGKKSISYKGMRIPRNTEETKLLKGHDNPLLETGILKRSVTFKVNRKGG